MAQPDEKALLLMTTLNLCYQTWKSKTGAYPDASPLLTNVHRGRKYSARYGVGGRGESNRQHHPDTNPVFYSRDLPESYTGVIFWHKGYGSNCISQGSL